MYVAGNQWDIIKYVRWTSHQLNYSLHFGDVNKRCTGLWSTPKWWLLRGQKALGHFGAPRVVGIYIINNDTALADWFVLAVQNLEWLWYGCVIVVFRHGQVAPSIGWKSMRKEATDSIASKFWIKVTQSLDRSHEMPGLSDATPDLSTMKRWVQAW